MAVTEGAFGGESRNNCKKLGNSFLCGTSGSGKNLCPHLFHRTVSVVANNLGTSVFACLLQKQSLGCVVLLTYLEFAQAMPEFSSRTAVCMRCESDLKGNL